MKPLLLFRADAGNKIGHGHVMRCLALAQAWKKLKGNVFFLMVSCPSELQSRLRAEGIALKMMKTSSGSSHDAFFTASLANEIKADWIVLDGYRFSHQYQKKIKEKNLKLMLIDDFGSVKRYDADMILDQNPGVPASLYRNRPAHSKLLLGQDYILLRDEFLKAKPKKSPRARIAKKILLTLGGASDTGPFRKNISKALAAISGLKFKIHYPSGNRNMALSITQADLAIIIAGGTLWELLHAGCPVISFYRNPQQRTVLQYLENRKVVQIGGSMKSFDPVRFASTVKHLALSSNARKRMAAQGRKIVDGLGSFRAARVMMESI